MISTFTRVSLRHFRHHKLRTAITVTGAAFGVAAMVGIRLVNETASRSFDRSIGALAGKTALQVSNGDVGVPEELLDELKAVPDIGPLVGTVHGFVPLVSVPGERLYILGVDLLADEALRDYNPASTKVTVEDPLIFLAQADSVALTSQFMDARGLAEGDSIRIQTPGGHKDLTIRATLAVTSGPATLFNGRIAVMDVFAAQRLFNLDRRFTEIDIGAPRGPSAALREDEIARVVGGRGVVERPERRGETLERLLAGTRVAFTVGALLANVLGLYLIFNALMTAVAQRQREFGVLRCLGMRRRQVFVMVVLESLVLGLLACVLGVPLGLAFARIIWSGYAASVSSRFLPVEELPLRLQGMPVLWAVASAFLIALGASILPTREAVRVQPRDALRPPETAQGDRGASYRFPFLIGVALLAARVLLPVLHGAFPGLPLTTLNQVGDLAILVAVSLMAPALVRAVASRVEGVVGYSFGPLVAIASRNIMTNVRRIAVTAAALLVSLAAAIGIATITAGFQSSFSEVIDSDFARLDLGVSSGSQFTGPSATPVPRHLAEAIAALPSVGGVDASRWVKIPYGGLLTYLVARDTRVYQEGLRTLTLLEGDRDTVLRRLAQGDAVFVSEVFARRFHKGWAT